MQNKISYYKILFVKLSVCFVPLWFIFLTAKKETQSVCFRKLGFRASNYVSMWFKIST